MSDNHLVERVKVLLSRSPFDGATAVYPVISHVPRPMVATSPNAPSRSSPVEPEQTAAASEPESPPAPAPVPEMLPDDALRVLSLAQRTAKEQIAAANRDARQTRADAETAADEIRRDAQAYSEQVRAEADSVLAAARAAAEQTDRDAHAEAAEKSRRAELALAEARSAADKIVAAGNEHSEHLKVRAQQRYDDAVGGLATKREALQKQIEMLEVFDADYRRRLTAFLQSQLRGLWADEPQAAEGLEIEAGEPEGSATTGETQ